MSVGLHRSSSKPLWEQARELIHDEIRTGTYKPGDRLPTENEYAQRFQISLNPVRAALQQLVLTGVIERINGRGTFVLDNKIANQLTLLSSCTQSLRSQGLAFEVRVIELGEVRGADTSEFVRTSLRVSARNRLFSLARLIIVEGEPAIILRTWLPASIVPSLVKEERFKDGISLYSYLSDAGIRLASAHARLDVEFADAEDADLLGVPFGAPLLAVRSVAFEKNGQPVEVSSIRYNSKRVSLTFEREIDPAALTPQNFSW